jgi:hypothetical protein
MYKIAAGGEARQTLSLHPHLWILDISVAVIHNESERMQKKVQNFLYLNKLKFLAVHEAEWDTIRLNLLPQDTIEWLRWHRPEVDWILHLQDEEITCTPAVVSGFGKFA